MRRRRIIRFSLVTFAMPLAAAANSPLFVVVTMGDRQAQAVAMILDSQSMRRSHSLAHHAPGFVGSRDSAFSGLPPQRIPN